MSRLMTTAAALTMTTAAALALLASTPAEAFIGCDGCGGHAYTDQRTGLGGGGEYNVRFTPNTRFLKKKGSGSGGSGSGGNGTRADPTRGGAYD